MLTLSFKVGEKFYIGNEITVYVRPHTTHPHLVKLSIDAPKDVKVLRDKLVPLRSNEESDK